VSQDILSPSTDESLVFRAVEMFHRRQIVAMLVSAAVMTSAISCAVPARSVSGDGDCPRRAADSRGFVRSAVNGELDSRLHVIKQEILSRDRLTDLVTRFNLYPELRAHAPMDSVLDQMRRDIEIELNGRNR
jgi:hypothetical protein